MENCHFAPGVPTSDISTESGRKYNKIAEYDNPAKQKLTVKSNQAAITLRYLSGVVL